MDVAHGQNTYLYGNGLRLTAQYWGGKRKEGKISNNSPQTLPLKKQQETHSMKPKLITLMISRQIWSQHQGERKLQTSFPEEHWWQTFTISYLQMEFNSVFKRSCSIITLFSLQGWKADLIQSDQCMSWTLGDSSCMIIPTDQKDLWQNQHIFRMQTLKEL